MTITPDTIVTGVDPDDIGVDLFRQVQVAAGSPAAPAAADGYAAVAEHGVSISFALAIFHRESQYATDPNAIVVNYATLNPGNCRTSRTGQGHVISTPRGPFVRYPSWEEGWRDLAFRLVDPTFAYVKEGRRTIRQIIERFAPASDSNNPDAYINAVCSDMNRWIGAQPVAGDDSRFQWQPEMAGEFGYPSPGTHGRSGQPIELLVLHITQGTDSLAWLRAAHGSSAHYLTDKAGKPRAQMVSEADAAWTAGSREYNERGINIEVEMLSVTDWTDAIMRETARTVAPIMQRNGIPAVYLGRDAGKGKRGMIGHADVPSPDGNGWGGSSHHTDPGWNQTQWVTFTSYVAAEMGGGGQPPTGADPVTGKYIASEFQQFYAERGGVDIFGRPVSGAFNEGDRLTQYMERSVFQHFPENAGTPYEVQLRLLGTDELHRRYPDGAPA